MEYIDYGLMIMSKKIIQKIPSDSFYDLADILSKLAQNNELLGFEIFKRFYEIGSFQGIQEFDKYIWG
jgi:NDP-sugar pyrophosphorylase family protein